MPGRWQRGASRRAGRNACSLTKSDAAVAASRTGWKLSFLVTRALFDENDPHEQKQKAASIGGCKTLWRPPMTAFTRVDLDPLHPIAPRPCPSTERSSLQCCQCEPQNATSPSDSILVLQMGGSMLAACSGEAVVPSRFGMSHGCLAGPLSVSGVIMPGDWSVFGDRGIYAHKTDPVFRARPDWTVERLCLCT